MHTAQGEVLERLELALSFVTTPYATIAHQDDIYLPCI